MTDNRINFICLNLLSERNYPEEKLLQDHLFVIKLKIFNDAFTGEQQMFALYPNFNKDFKYC